MKAKLFSQITAALLCMVLMTSCYTYTTVVGAGAKGNTEVKEWNTYLLFGLARVDLSDAKLMAAGATDYTVITSQSFVNGLLSAITFGIYTPTTTTVRK